MTSNSGRGFMGIRMSRPVKLADQLQSIRYIRSGSAPQPPASAPETVGLLIERGDRARDAGDWHKAVIAYAEALRAKPSLMHIWVQYGHALKESGDVAQALAAYRSALEIAPDVADTHLQLGHALKLSQRFADAAQAYLTSYRLDPSGSNARAELIRLGWSSVEIALASQAHEGDGDGELLKHYGGVRQSDPARNCPADYSARNPDVARLLRQGLIDSPEQHYRLYGYREGRDVIQSLAARPPTRAFVLCPSNFKRCGIGEHARYMAECLKGMGLDVVRIRTTRELALYDSHQLKDAVVIVNHGPGLFDGYNPELSEGESTADLIVALQHYFVTNKLRSIIYMHSLLDSDNTEIFGRQEFLLEAPIPKVTTIAGAAEYFHIPHIEHGVQPLASPPSATRAATNGRDLPTIGFFGFLQFGGKDFDAISNVVTALNAKLVGSVASRDPEQIRRLAEFLASRGVRCDLATGWISDDELARRLNEADFLYLPQKDHDHWNNSGTARFGANMDIPIILPPHQPFLDLKDVAIFAEEHDVPAVIAYLRNQTTYAAAIERVRRYRATTSMNITISELVHRLPHVVQQQSWRGFAGINTTSATQLASLPPEIFVARATDSDAEGTSLNETTLPEDRGLAITKLQNHSTTIPVITFQVAEPIQFWKRHYRIEEFFIKNKQDIIFSLYRRLQKRDPTYFEYMRMTQGIPADDRGLVLGSKVGVWLVDALAQLLGSGVERSAGQPIELSVFEELTTPGVLLRDRLEIASKISGAFDRAEKAVAAMPPNRRWRLDPIYDRNLLVLAALPGPLAEDALEEVCRSEGFAINVRGIGELRTIRQRYLAFLTRCAEAMKRPADIFLIDRPMMQPVNPFRALYAMSEFVVHDGDAFVTAVLRALLKRDPFVVELLILGRQLEQSGKFELVRHVVHTMACNATVVDLEQPDHIASALADMEEAERRRLYNDVRSVSGNWTIRNACLAADRDFQRLWLRLKAQKDVWWTLCGQRIGNVTL